MLKNKKVVYFCQECGYESSKWMGQCPGCRAWNTFVEETVSTKKVSSTGSSLQNGLRRAEPVVLKDIRLSEDERKLTNIGELDRVLGGGIVPGSLVLVGGDPGIGKSTLLLQVCRNLAMSGNSVLYISGEESLRQIKLRAERIGEFNENLQLLCETNLEGPRVLEHMVDTVLYFEGDRHASYRILRAVKNRFGSTNEIGVFEMRNTGLEEVKNPSEFMLNGKPNGTSGSIVACSMEGTRPILVEIQALVCQSNFGIPRRTAVGTDFNRVNLLMAVLEKKVGIHLAACDAYVNIAGGMKMTEPAIDLGISLAVVSSCKDIIIPDSVIAFGEVGLSGEVRAVSMAGQRVAEAKKLGFDTVILPEVCKSSVGKVSGINLVYVSWIQDAIRYIMKKN